MREKARFIQGALVIVAVAGALVAPALAASDNCVSAVVPGPMVLPDGTAYPAGPIQICLTEKLSPVAGLHETSVGGHPVGMFLSRLSRIEASPATHPEATFHFMLTSDGVWILEAYAMPVGQRVILYKLRSGTPPSPLREPPRVAEETPVVLAAASGR
jgi:hypothetical protein